MDKIQKYVERQQDIGEEIKKLRDNFKKDGAVRKTGTYTMERCLQLEKYWEEFTKNHEKMKQLGAPESVYFTTNYYGQAEPMYTEAKKGFMRALQTEPEIEQTTSQRITKEGTLMYRTRRFRIKLLDEAFNEASDLLQQEEITENQVSKMLGKLQGLKKALDDSREEVNVKEENANQLELIENENKQVYDKLWQITNELEYQRRSLETATRVEIPIKPIQLDAFDGNYEKWNSFQELFIQVIDSKRSISKIEKFQYLKTYVRGEASKLIQHLQVTEVNYDTAWEILQNRYNNKRLITARLVDRILDLPTITYESAEKLKQLHDVTKECLKALENLGIPTGAWGAIVSRLIVRKWDFETNKLYEQTLRNPHEMQDFSELMQFLETRFQSLESIGTMKKRQTSDRFSRFNNGGSWKEKQWYAPPENRSSQNLSVNQCKMCGFRHHLYNCNKFRGLTVSARSQFISAKKMCPVCLDHEIWVRCNSAVKCSVCRRNHHVLLHEERGHQQTFAPRRPTSYASASRNTSEEQTRQQPYQGRKLPPSSSVAHIVREDNVTKEEDEREVILATALIKVKALLGNQETLRALVDTGSQVSFISEQAAQMLGLPRQKIRAEVTGIGAADPKIVRGKISVEIQPHYSRNYQLVTNLLVLPKLTQTLPQKEVEIVNLDDWKNHNLADPTYNVPGQVDVILGAKDYGQIMKEGLKRSSGLLAQNSELGWLLSGTAKKSPVPSITVVSMITRAEEDEQLTKFWEIEEIPEKNHVLSEADRKCEENYEETHKRNPDGSYTVKIPFKDESQELGDSRKRAVARLLQLERRFEKNKKLEEDYKQFMKEYEEMGHMSAISTPIDEPGSYYIPHQPVIREASTTTKLRVVFDASCKTSSGVSLNDNMYKGPRLQHELFDILLRWRTHKIVFIADIEKMYRQIKIAEEDKKTQKILWRSSTRDPIQEFTLNTITYGLAASPYLAIKTLQQLAKDEREKFPQASEIVMRDFYVDDVLSGANTLESALKNQKQLIQMLKTGGLTLRKWSSNNGRVLEAIPAELREESTVVISEDEELKTLGVHWNSTRDVFKFQVERPHQEVVTKRSILSTIAKLFDPLGWLAPVIINAKIMMQELWVKKLEWDQQLPEDIQARWEVFSSQLQELEHIEIPRWMNYEESKNKVEIHGFCDASEAAYGAVVYSKTRKRGDQVKITLLVAKSKVAPIKLRKTLPRLELCAAVLLGKLLKRTCDALNIPVSVHAWTDSMITLAWIKGEPDKWNTFVANRVAEIHSNTNADCWNHVRTQDNPADVLSRGINPSKLKSHQLWWNGPGWLHTENQNYNHRTIEIQPTTEEMKKCHQVTVAEKRRSLAERFSSLTKMIRVIAYCQRFQQNCRSKTKKTGSLQVSELGEALKTIIKDVQQSEMGDIIANLKAGKVLDKQQKLSSLSPFQDEDGIIRVGGRLAKSSLKYSEKHPIIIPNDSHLARLIIENAHKSTLHGGNQTTLAFLRRQYWIIKGKQMVSKILRRCIPCAKQRAQGTQQIMGNLPAARITPSPPFTHTGVDYAGPIQVRATKGRGFKSYKGYIAVFVCLATKAIHLEVVSELSTEAFLAAFRRFCARRGQCRHMYSDNGTNFVGASKQFEREVQEITKNGQLQDRVVTLGTQWHFIPPAAPHFGGLWEAGVKSMKHHLKRIVGGTTLTYEELTTLVTQIEACLNSRPLCPLNNEVEEATALTPAHFLIGQALISPQDYVATTSPINVKDRWKLLQKMNRDFWKAWTEDYLHHLQQKYKWKKLEDNLKVGELVLIKEDNINPNKWPLARVTEVFAGSDGAVRVANIKQAGGTILKRPVVKLIKLPVQAEEVKNNDEPTVRVAANTARIRKPVEKYPENGKSKKVFYKLWFIWIMLSSMMQSNQAAFTLKHPDPGLYVEHLGSAKVERGRFRIEVQFPKSRIKEDGNDVNKTVQKFTELCNQAKELTSLVQCSTLVHNLNELQQHFRWTSDAVQGVIADKKTRIKRGALGKMLTAVFGVNDEVYEDIRTLDKQQQELIKAAGHQTKFMLSAISTFNHTEQRVNNQLSRFKIKVDEIIDAVNKMKKWYKAVNEDTLSIKVLNAYQIASDYIQEIQEQYNKLADVHYNRGHIYEFLSPVHIAEIINTANAKLPSNIQIQENPVLQTTVGHSELQIHVYGYFPITENAEYTVIAVNAIPVKIQQNMYYTAEITNELMAVDYDHQNYFEMSKEELSVSIKLPNDEYLITPATVRNMESSPNCVINELYQRWDKTSCKIIHKQIQETIWKQLYMKNTWLFITIKPTRIGIVCSGIREEVILNRTGILQITQDCVIKTKQIILAAQMTKEHNVKGSFIQPARVEISSEVEQWQMEPEIQKEAVLNSNNDLQKLKRDEDALQQEFQEKTWKHVRDRSTIISATTLSIILIIIGTLWGIQRVCNKSTRKRDTNNFELRVLNPEFMAGGGQHPEEASSLV